MPFRNLRAAFLARGAEVLRREEIGMELSFGLHLLTPTEASAAVKTAIAQGLLVPDGEGYRLAASGEGAEGDAKGSAEEARKAAPRTTGAAAAEAEGAVKAPRKGAGAAASRESRPAPAPAAPAPAPAAPAAPDDDPQLFRELVALAVATGVAEREVIKRINRGQRRHLGVSPEVEALYVARECGAEIAPFVARVEARLLRDAGGAGDAG